MAEVDLHLHTNQSDGRLMPAELIALVAARGLKVVAVTDHDITDGLESAMAAAAAICGLTRCVRPPRPWRPSKLRLPLSTAAATRDSWLMALEMDSSRGPLLPMQVVQP